MSWGTVTVGRVVLREVFDVAESNNGKNGRRLTLSGEESSPPLTRAEVVARHNNIVGLNDSDVPVIFTSKPEKTGYYRVDNADSELVDYPNNVTTAKWKITLEFLGTHDDIEFESRLIPAKRAPHPDYNTYVPSDANLWHAVPSKAYSYYFPGASPTAVTTRPASDGNSLKVYTGIPTTSDPRWTIKEADFYQGAVTLTVNGNVVVGDKMPSTITSWEINNTLFRIKSDATYQFTTSMWDANDATPGWRNGAAGSPDFDPVDVPARISLGGTYAAASGGVGDYAGMTALSATPTTISILRNTPEFVAIRLTYSHAVARRVVVDLSLKRGARMMFGFIQHDTTLSNVALEFFTGENRADTDSQAPGFYRGDLDGSSNRSIIGSSLTISDPGDINSQPRLIWAHVFGSTPSPFSFDRRSAAIDFVFGWEYGGASALAGDTFAALAGQYYSNPDETMHAVRKL